MAETGRPEETAGTAQEVAELLRTVKLGLHRLTKAHPEGEGLSLPQLMALRFAAEHSGLTLTELSRRMGLANSTVSGIVDRLVRDGLLARVPDPQDRRVYRVIPTPQAQARREKVVAAYRAVLTEVLGRLDPEELAALKRSLTALARVLEQSNEE